MFIQNIHSASQFKVHCKMSAGATATSACPLRQQQAPVPGDSNKRLSLATATSACPWRQKHAPVPSDSNKRLSLATETCACP